MAATSNVWICTIGNCHLPKLCYSHGLWWNKLFLDHAIRSGCEICPKYFLLAYQTMNYNKCSFRVFSFSVARPRDTNELEKDQCYCFLAIFAISCGSMFVSSCCIFFCQISPLLSSPLHCFADDKIVQVHTLYGIWADDQELVRNLASLSAAPTLPSPLFSIMMLWCSKFQIRWWLTCFWGLYYCYYSFFWYIIVL